MCVAQVILESFLLRNSDYFQRNDRRCFGLVFFVLFSSSSSSSMKEGTDFFSVREQT